MSTQVAAGRVRALIRDSGLTQAEFAVKAGLDAPKLSKSLSGVRRFTSLDLARIAEVGGTTVDWLLGAEKSTPALAARAEERRGPAVEWAIEQATLLSNARAGLTYLGNKHELPFLPDRPTASRWVDQGEALANAAVAHLVFRRADPTEGALADLVEKHFGADVAVLDIPPGFDGLSWQDDHAWLIVAATSQTPTRQRFTIAHELGHLLARDDQKLHVDEDVSDSADRESEVRANAFAAAFLMPYPALEPAVRSDELSNAAAFADLVMRLAVSPSALWYRLFNVFGLRLPQHLRRLTTAECAQLAGQSGQFAERLTAAARTRLPKALVRDTYNAYVAGDITLRPLANLLGVPADSLRESLEATPRTEGLDFVP
jgi:Zn-dependent peptidase ImmA (M78 family)/transcriptional regulator with XRE-family HTH domain